MGGGSAEWAWAFPLGSGHVKGRCLMPPGSSMSRPADSVALRTSICPAASPGKPNVLPKGYSMATSRGTLAEAVSAGTLDRQIVLNPAASILDATSPTDQLQRGQMGTRTTRSTWSSWSIRTMAGVDSSRRAVGSRV